MMLFFSIVLLVLIAVTYYSLAKEHHKTNLWLWSILGIVAYYGSVIITAFFFGLFGFLFMDMMSANAEFGTEADMLKFQKLGELFGLFGGIIGSFFVYRYLKYRWSKDSTENDDYSDDNE